MKFGFISNQSEFIPEIFSSLDVKNARLYFLNQYNACVDDELKIPLYYGLEAKNIENIFQKRIKFLIENLDIENVKKNCFTSYLIIKNYKKNRLKIPHILENPQYKVAKLIKLVYCKDIPGLVFDSKDFFKNFVFSKIKNMHKDKIILINDDVLYLPKKDGKHLCIVPSFSKFNTRGIGKFNEDLNKAFNMCDKQNDIYLVLPRQENLCRHIEIKRCNSFMDSQSIKVVPYSINNKIIKKG